MMHDAEVRGAFGPNLSRRNLLMGAGLLGTAAVAHAMVPRNRIDLLGKSKLEALVPERIGRWEFLSKMGLVVPPEDALADKLYAQMLTRVYVSQERLPMMLLIAQSPGQDGVLQVHRPEVCYPASGFTLSDSRVHNIPIGDGRTIPTRVFTASGADRVEQLIYWTRIGRDLPTSWAQQRLSVAEANLRGDVPDAVLVRISTVSADPAALGEVDEFARAMIAGMNPRSRPVLVGSANA
jgi:EpsI family protein